MAVITVTKQERVQIIVAFPMYFKNHNSEELVKMNSERDGIEITKTSIKQTILSVSDYYGMYKIATEEEFNTLFQETKSNINSLLIMASSIDSLPHPKEDESNSIQEKIPTFPNGFDRWQESHYDISTAIAEALMRDMDSGNEAKKTDEEIGTGGVYDLAKSLTDKFEMENKDVNWDGEMEYYDTMEAFIINEIYGKSQG